MLNPAQTGCGRQVENGGFPPEKAVRRQPCREKNALYRPVCPVADRMADPDAS